MLAHSQQQARGRTCFVGPLKQVVQQLDARREAALLPQAWASAAQLLLLLRLLPLLCPLCLLGCAAVLPSYCCLRWQGILCHGRTICCRAEAAPAEVCKAAQLQLQPPGVQRDLQQAGPAAEQAPAVRACNLHSLHPGTAFLLLQLLYGRRLALQHVCHRSCKGLLHWVLPTAAALAALTAVIAARLRCPCCCPALTESRHKALQPQPQLSSFSQLLQQARDAAAGQGARRSQQRLKPQQGGCHALQRQQGMPCQLSLG